LLVKSHFRQNAVMAAALCAVVSSVGFAQTKPGTNPDPKSAKVDAGTIIPVHMNEAIDVQRADISAATVLAHPITRVYRGVVERDVQAEGGRTAIPKGSPVELMVKVGKDNGLLMDFESVTVNGQRYGVRAEANKDEGMVGEIMPDQSTGELGGPAVKVERDSIVTFRLKRPLQVGIEDRGTDRDGVHYHGEKGTGG